jgi:hypothetical protein
MLLCGQEFNEEIIEKIRETIADNSNISRRILSVEVCRWLNWKSPNGKLQEMSCRVALLRLERRGLIKLPPPRCWKGTKAKRNGLDSSSVQVDPLRSQLEELGEIELVRIDRGDSERSRIWNCLLNRYHYLGSGPLCGAQMRYLIKSNIYGWLGGLAFSAPAWRIEPRDRWIGWSETTRWQNLNRVVCNSRFLIPSQVQVPNLASHVLSLAAHRLVRDWEERYGLTPLLLETFVERDRFSGACYRAANWQCVGITQGRGRQDRQRRRLRSVKGIYIYPLQREAREKLCSSTFPSKVELKQKKPAQVQDWPEEEFAQADLGDQRLEKRLISIVRDFYARPQASIPQACHSRAKTKATYRFLEHPEMTMDKVLHSHYESTLERMQKEKIVLAVQDTTALDYSAHPATEGLGPIGKSKEKSLGLVLHDTLALNPEGVPLGLVDVQCWARDKADFGKKRFRHELPIEQKESNKWLISYQKTAVARKRCPGTTIISVGDREADIYELFALAFREIARGGPHLLVRAMHDRSLGENQGHLWENLARQEVSGIQEVRIPRRGNHPARVAKLEVRFAQVNLKPPQVKARLANLTVYGVLAREINTPEDLEPVEWLLLTTLVVSTFEQAVEKLRWYTVRWNIEVYHRTLKTGCQIEERRLGAADRIETCLAIDMVVAWRIVHLTKLGRDTPDVPCTIYFEEAEWKALIAYITRNPVAPEQPPTLREATRMVASLGGFLGRKSDGEPGVQSLWLGLEHLDDITEMWKIMNNRDVPHPKKRIVSSNPEYG